MDINVFCLFPQNQSILWDAVTDAAAAAVDKNGEWPSLPLLQFACCVYLEYTRKLEKDAHHYPSNLNGYSLVNTSIARTKVTGVYLDLLEQLTAKASSSADQARITCTLITLAQDVGLLQASNYHLQREESSLKLFLHENHLTNFLKYASASSCVTFSSQLVGHLTTLLLKQPVLASIVIDKFQEMLSINPKTKDSLRLWPSLMSTSLLEKASSENNDPNILCQLLHVLPDDDMTYRKITEVDLSCVIPTGYTNLNSFLMTCLISRPSMKLYHSIFNRKWHREITSPQLIFTSTHDTSNSLENLKVDSCTLLALREKVHFVDHLISYDVSKIDLSPELWQLFYLVIKIHSCQVRARSISLESAPRSVTFPPLGVQKNPTPSKLSCYLSRLSSIVSEPPGHLLEHNSITRNLVNRLEWIFTITQWSLSNIPSTLVNEASLRESFMMSLINCQAPLRSLAKFGILKNIDFDRSDLTDQLANQLNKMNLRTEVMIFYSYLALLLSFQWLFKMKPAVETSEHSRSSSDLSSPVSEAGSLTDDMSDTQDFDESQSDNIKSEMGLKLKFLVNKIKILTLRTEVLENMYSLLFVTRDDLIDTSSSDVDASSRDSASFLAVDENIPPYLTLLKDMIFETQRLTWNMIRKNSSKKPDYEYDECELEYFEPEDESNVTSITSLSDARVRLDTLIQLVNEAHWRLSVVSPAVTDDYSLLDVSANDKCQHLIMKYMLSSPRELLRFALVSDHVERARQVYRLFDKQLEHSDEVKQLRVIEKINGLSDEVKHLLANHYKKQSQSPLFTGSSSVRSNTLESKNLHVSQFSSLLDLFYSDVYKIDSTYASVIMIDYALTKCSNLEVTQLALDRALKYLSAKDDCNTQLFEFLRRLNKLITVLKNASHIYEQETSLSQLMTSNFNKNLFSNPNVLLEEAIHQKKLKECVEDIRQLLFSENAYDSDGDCSRYSSGNVDINEFVSDSRPRMSPSDSEGKKILLLFQKLLRLVPCGKHNFLKGLFYHVRRVSQVLNECKQRSRSLSNTGIDIASEAVSLNSPSRSPPAVERKNEFTSSRSKVSIHSPTTVTPISFFSVLYQSPSAHLCQMILKENIPPHLVDDLSNQMKIDLIGTLCSILCPPLPVQVKYEELSMMTDFNLMSSSYPALCDLIESHLTGHLRRQLSSGQRENDASILIENHFNTDASPEEFDQEYNRNIISKTDLIVYFRNKSPIVVELLRLMKLIDEKKVDLFTGSVNIFHESSPLQKYISTIKEWFGNSGQDDTSLVTLALHPLTQVTSSLVLKSLEKYAEMGDFASISRILQMIHRVVPSEYHCKSILTLEAALFAKLAITTGEIRYLLQMKDSSAKIGLLLDMIASSNDATDSTSSYLTDPSEAIKALTAIRGSVLASNDSSPQLLDLLDTKLREVSCYSKIASLAGLKRWKDAQDSLTEADILTILKAKKQYSLALKWNELTNLHEQMHSSDTQIEYLRNELLVLSYAEKGDMDKTSLLVKELVESKSANLVIKCIGQIDNWNMKQVLIEQVIQHEGESDSSLMNSAYLLGLKLIQLLQPHVRGHYSSLVSSPSLIIEQMLMNTEYNALEQALKVHGLIKCDDLIECYAKKAVDIKLIGEDCLSLAGSEYTCISSSFVPSPSIYSASSQTFTMPSTVPSRDQWIPDRKVTHCMVCKIEKFSVIFNRKHHCRRCGRVVCSSCSDRLIVIPEIHATSPVRVCITCFSSLKASQPLLTADMSRISERRESMSSHSSSISVYQWLLSLDKEQNRTVRTEFYYEAAPSASLCLSILRLHSDANACVKLIIDQLIRNLFEVLTSSQIDYGLLLSIIKSLLVAAKMLILQANRSTVLDASSRIKYIDLMLSRVDIVRMLVEHNCINKELINYIILNESQSNKQSLVKLMEKLLEVEHFELALNLAKKHGLEVKGIWKTWALICLRSGKFTEARAKWKHVMVDTSINSTSASSVNGRNLQLIIDILANQRTSVKLNQKHTLKDRVDLIRKGKANQLCKGIDVSSSLSDHLTTEAKYYLDSFGCREDWVRFYSRFGRWREALDVLLSESSGNVLSSCFVSDFLVPALRKSCLGKVLALIKSCDGTLTKSSKYLIASCRYFTKHGYFNVLHSLQLFMSDYLRATITQVTHFYLAKPIAGYDVLASRLEHLVLARGHLNAYLEHRSHLVSVSYVLNQPVEQVKKNIRTINYQIEITRAFAHRSVDASLLSILEEEASLSSTSTPCAEKRDSKLPARKESISKSLQSNSPSLHPDSAWLHSSLSTSFNSSSPRRRTRSSSIDSGSTLATSTFCPLTLLDESKKKRTQLTALVIVELADRIAEGFNLACKLIQEYKLDAGLVLRFAGRLILTGKKVTIIDRLNQLLNCIKNSYNSEIVSAADSLVSSCIRASPHPELIDPMIKMITSDITKIDAYIQAGRLRPAYLLAVRLERQADVRRILSVAEKSEQEIVRTWCSQWLEKNSRETFDSQ